VAPGTTVSDAGLLLDPQHVELGPLGLLQAACVGQKVLALARPEGGLEAVSVA